MDCLVAQNRMASPAPQVGDAGITVDIGQEVKSFVQANPIPSIGLALAVGYALYILFKNK
jgi:hypothetical protein